MKHIPIPALLALLAISTSASLHGQIAGERYAIGAAFVKEWHSTCPAFLGGIYAKSPAARAGLRSGDKLLKVNGRDASSFSLQQIGQIVASDQPGQISLIVSRNRQHLTFTVTREKYSSILAENGMKEADGTILTLDESPLERAEKSKILHFDSGHINFRVFPAHYPLDKDRFYGGFEVYVFREPELAVVGGIETGPASRAGIHWGDTILAVNGTSVKGKSLSEFEELLSSDHPVSTRLLISRNGSEKELTYTLAKASDVLAQNGKRRYKGNTVPTVEDEDLHCFDE